MIKTKLKAAALKPGKAGMIGVLKEVLYMMYAAEDVIGTNVKQLVDKFANDVERKQFMVMISSIQELNGIVNKLLEKGRICKIQLITKGARTLMVPGSAATTARKTLFVNGKSRWDSFNVETEF
jgi:G:T/U-mismatch repair DNA glycosylase